jgi:hypothetical protein
MHIDFSALAEPFGQFADMELKMAHVVELHFHLAYRKLVKAAGRAGFGGCQMFDSLGFTLVKQAQQFSLCVWRMGRRVHQFDLVAVAGPRCEHTMRYFCLKIRTPSWRKSPRYVGATRCEVQTGNL